MSAANRANQIGKLQKVCKKHFQPVKPSENRNVFETLIFGCCLENATFEQAEEAFARLQESYFDWNEVRVTTAPELAESMVGIHDPNAAATRVKKCLHAIFETHYSFDLDFLKKENLGKAIDKIKGYKGISEFVVSYVAQSALGGHSIPLGDAEMQLFLTIDAITEKELAKYSVPGLERAIPKSKGIEFFSTIHQLAVPFLATPNSTKVWAIVSEIDPKSKARFNQRVKDEKAARERAEEERKQKRLAVRKNKAAAKKAAAKKAEAKKGVKKSVDKKTAETKPSAAKSTPTKKTTKKKPAAPTKKATKVPSKRLVRKKPR